MMKDHFIISSVRNHLSDALKALLKAEIMTAEDFAASRNESIKAIEQLDVLLRKSHGD